MLSQRDEPKSGVFGPALVDSTRLALSSFDIWGDILATNRSQILEALQTYVAKLEEFRHSLEEAPDAETMYRIIKDQSGGATGAAR